MIDWKTIELEYVTSDISQEQLAKKFGIGRSRLSQYASKEKWREKRDKHRAKTVEKAVNAVGTKQANMAAKLYETGGMLLDTVKRLIEENPELLAETSSMKDVSVVLKNLKDLMSVKSEADMLEQEARIAKLRKEAEKDDVSHAHTLVVEGLPEEFKV
jgi:transcriptional regulator with XRE-family HTH domain